MNKIIKISPFIYLSWCLSFLVIKFVNPIVYYSWLDKPYFTVTILFVMAILMFGFFGVFISLFKKDEVSGKNAKRLYLWFIANFVFWEIISKTSFFSFHNSLYFFGSITGIVILTLELILRCASFITVGFAILNEKTKIKKFYILLSSLLIIITCISFVGFLKLYYQYLNLQSHGLFLITIRAFIILIIEIVTCVLCFFCYRHKNIFLNLTTSVLLVLQAVYIAYQMISFVLYSLPDLLSKSDATFVTYYFYSTFLHLLLFFICTVGLVILIFKRMSKMVVK